MEIKYTHGNVLTPSSSRPKMVNVLVIPVDNGGVFGHSGIYRAVNHKFPHVAEIYEGKANSLKLGDIVTVKCEAAGTSSDYTSVVLAILMDSESRDRMLKEHLEKVVGKLKSYARNYLDVCYHMPKIGHGTDLDWDEVSELLEAKLCSNGIECVVYKYKRGRRSERDEEEEDEPESGDELPAKRRRRTLMRSSTKYNDDESSDSSSGEDSEESVYEESGSEGEAGSDDDEVEEGDSDEGSDDYDDDDDMSDKENSKKPKWKKPVKTGKNDKKPAKPAASSHVQIPRQPKIPPEFIIKVKHVVAGDNPLKDYRISLYGFNDEMIEELSTKLENLGAKTISEESDLLSVDLAIVPETIKEREDILEEFKKLFDTDCIFVEEDWKQVLEEPLQPLNVEPFVI